MRNEKNESNLVQVSKHPGTEVFSFELPKGTLKAHHVEAFLTFIQENESAHVMKSLLALYFTALENKHIQLTDEQSLCFEHTLTLLADLSCQTPSN